MGEQCNFAIENSIDDSLRLIKFLFADSAGKWNDYVMDKIRVVVTIVSGEGGDR